jgi:hypothetical protein
VAALYEKKEITGGCNEFDMGQKHNGTTMRKSKENCTCSFTAITE